MTDDKVFCRNCKYFSSFHYMGGGYDDCEAEGNKKWSHNWRSRTWSEIRKPWKINKFNDCRWYEKKLGVK